MNGQIYLWEITRYLAWFTSQVRIENNSGNFDINKYAESFFIPILNSVFNSHFERLEYIKQNYPSIDLGSKDHRISFQITAETGFDKIKNTLTKYIENKLFETYSEIYHLIIDEDYKTNKLNSDIANHIKIELEKISITPLPQIVFDIENNLWNIKTLRARIERDCNIDQLKEIRDYLEKQYGKVTALPSIENIIIPYEIAFKSQLDKNNINLPIQFHTPFLGREGDLEKLDMFVRNQNKSVMSIVADGGYGKTRLVIEFFRRKTSNTNNCEAYVLDEVAFQSMDFAEQLKSEKEIMILFDDAHKKPEILNDLIRVANRFENVKLILTVRKAVYFDTLKSIATHGRVMDTLEISRLSYNETQELFKTQLPRLNSIEIKRLAEASKGIPIVVLGLCQVTLNGKYKSELTEELNFIYFVRELKEQVIIDIHKKYFISEESINKTLQLLSFFSPIRNIPEEICEISKLNDLSVEDTNLILDYLAEYDFIHKQKEIYIKPDSYNDTILLDSALRIKYLLQSDIKIFIDRLIRNLVEVEQSQRLDLSIDNLLFDFISSFKSKVITTINDIKNLETNLDTLISFTFKKPQICFLAIKHLVNSQLSNDKFWQKEEKYDPYLNSFKNVHESIETVLAISALNTYEDAEFDDIYVLLQLYESKKEGSNAFHKIFSYKVYDFIEYGYCPLKPFARQLYLVRKLQYLFLNEQSESILINHIFNCCKTLLLLEFEGESFYDKYTHEFTIGRYLNVIYNEKTSSIRENALELFLKIYELTRFSNPSNECFQEIVKTLFFMAKQTKEVYEYNQKAEVKLVIEFLKGILNNNPSILERSIIIEQLKLFERNEIKKEYVILTQELLEISENVDTPKDKLNLLLLDEFYSLRKKPENKFKEVIKQYPNWKQFYDDIIEIKIILSPIKNSNFYEIISQLIKCYPERAKELLDYVIENYPQYVCDYTSLIKANYKDLKYFYGIIEKIWTFDQDGIADSVLWMLTYGRCQDVKLYQESDLKYVDYVIENKNLRALWSISFTLPMYILVSPVRTIEIISKILNSRENVNENRNLIHAIFENDDILISHSELIRNFVFAENLEQSIDSYLFEYAISFLDNFFGFNTMFEYIQKKVAFLELHDDYFNLSVRKKYDNPKKGNTQKEKEFLLIIEWYADLPNKSEYLHKKLVQYLRPAIIPTDEFVNGFKMLIAKAGKNIEKIVDLCSTLDVNEQLIALLIEICNGLCLKYKLTNENLIQFFGSNFVYNFGMKSGPSGIPFPQDIVKRDFLTKLIGKYEMHVKVKEVFLFSLNNVEKDIKREELGELDEKW